MNLTESEIKDKFEKILEEEGAQDLEGYGIHPDKHIERSEKYSNVFRYEISYIKDLTLSVCEEDIDFLDYILNHPERCLDALKEVVEKEIEISRMDYSQDDEVLVGIRNLTNNKIETPRTLSSEEVGKYRGLKGVVSRVYPPRVSPEQIKFECEDCKGIFKKEQKKRGALDKPLECEACGKSTNKTNLIPTDEESEYYDYQVVYIEEIDRSGQKAREVKAILTKDLVDEVSSGDEVVFYGIYSTEYKGRKQEPRTFFEVKAIDILNKDFENLELTEEEEQEVEELSNDPDVLDKISNSIAVSIKGMGEEKKSIALQMFRGNRKEIYGNPKRGDIHILLAGDPQTSKSSLLDYTADVCPRSRKGSGEGTSGAGLVGAAVQDEKGNWYLATGVLPLADKGVACIDEFDKMGKDDRNKLHKAMEQQEVPINKADIHQTLRTRTSILAACNPPDGKFEKRDKLDNDYLDTINDQFGYALVSRFDIIWFLTSDILEKNMGEISKHISNQHLEYSRKKRDPSYDVDEEYKPEIEKDLLTNYIKKGREISPRLTQDASDIIEGFIKDLGNKNIDGYKPREHESLIRLAEASAKAHHSEIVRPKDAEIAIELKKAELKRLKEIGIDLKKYFEKKYSGSSEEKRTLKSYIRDTIRICKGNSKSRGAAEEDILEMAEKDDFDREKAKKELERMKTNGDVYRPEPGRWDLA